MAMQNQNDCVNEESQVSRKNGRVKSTLISRNVTITGRRTSVRLEPEMWVSLNEIAKRECCSSHDVCSLVSLCKNEDTSLTAAIRVFIMLYFRAASTESGHDRAGHGGFDIMRTRAHLGQVRQARAESGAVNGQTFKSVQVTGDNVSYTNGGGAQGQPQAC